MVTPDRALINPVAQGLNVFFTESRVVKGHPLVGIGQRQPANHFAGVGIARYDGQLARFSGSEGLVFEQHRKTSRFFHAPVAGNAIFI